MKKILLFLLEGYADWESEYASAKLNKAELGYCVQTISLNDSPVISQGNISTNIDYSLDSFHDFSTLSAFILIGGIGWGNRNLIRGYNLGRYDSDMSNKINDFINKCLSSDILVAAICDGVTFLADNGYLDSIVHTGNTVEYLQEKAPLYKGTGYFKEKQAVTDHNIITANGTAALEFVREILIKMNMLENEKQAIEWFDLYKKGYYLE
ncbi:DJ-1/PfpI family protein [Pectinatus sottacetonis]|uniref:DJ-1/PfpI family protein n=1 Tax=Pectinatus sottacetonis TaxID=1002795 RepID=UPI0018C76AE2|nr:DJ-1/PfpI family protein [Pectinatus sottacetonis]